MAGPPPQGYYPPPPNYYPPPPQAPLANLFGPGYILPYETTLIMKEKCNWSGDDMDIKDVTGVCHFKLKAKVFSLHNKRVIYDINGLPVCSTMAKVLSLHSKTWICPGDNPQEKTALAEIQKVIFTFKPEGHVFFKDNHSGNPDIIIKGTFFELSFQIIDSFGRLLADISRDFASAKSLFLGKETYYVRILPGVDTALMVVLVTIIEEMFVEAAQKDDN